MEKLAAGRKPAEKLWHFTMPELRIKFMEACRLLGLEMLKPCLYMGRHSGASLDRLEGRYSLDEVQKRGRWRSTASVRRYEKHALVQKVVT